MSASSQGLPSVTTYLLDLKGYKYVPFKEISWKMAISNALSEQPLNPQCRALKQHKLVLPLPLSPSLQLRICLAWAIKHLKNSPALPNHLSVWSWQGNGRLLKYRCGQAGQVWLKACQLYPENLQGSGLLG